MENEDNIAPPTEDVASKQVTHLVKQAEDVANHTLSKLIRLSADNIYHESTCLVCKSPYRNEIESMYANHGADKYDKIKELCKTKSQIEISKDIVDNHIRHHSDAGIREIQKGEYITRLLQLSKARSSPLQILEESIAACQERLVGINSIVPNSAVSAAEVEKIKTDGTAKITTQLSKLIGQYNTMITQMQKTDEDLIKIPSKPFIDIFNAAAQKAQTKDEKTLIEDILKELVMLQM